MNNRNEDCERKSWESSKSDNSEQMPMYPMQNYNPCMYCPMMYGNISMKGSIMMPKYGKQSFREEEAPTEGEEYRRYHHGHHYYHHHYYHPYYAPWMHRGENQY